MPKASIPPAVAGVHSVNFSAYAVYKNRFWCIAYDNLGNEYMYRSDDLGRNWQSFPYNVPQFGFGFAFADKLNGIAVGFPFDGVNQSFEAVTHDGGETWTQKTDFTGYVMGGFITVIPGTHTYVSTLPGFTPVYGSSYSRDGGKSWVLIDSGGLQGEHSDVAFLNPFYGWTGRAEAYDGDKSGGAFKWKLHFSLDDKAIAANDANVSSVIKNDVSNSINARLYPNPAKDVIRVEGLTASAKTTLSLYNISGKLIQQATSNNESHQFKFKACLSLSCCWLTISIDCGIS